MYSEAPPYAHARSTSRRARIQNVPAARPTQSIPQATAEAVRPGARRTAAATARPASTRVALQAMVVLVIPATTPPTPRRATTPAPRAGSLLAPSALRTANTPRNGNAYRKAWPVHGLNLP